MGGEDGIAQWDGKMGRRPLWYPNCMVKCAEGRRLIKGMIHRQKAAVLVGVRGMSISL